MQIYCTKYTELLSVMYVIYIRALSLCLLYIHAHAQFKMYTDAVPVHIYTGVREPVIRALGRDTGPPWRGVNSPIARFPSSWFPRVLRVIIHDSCVRVRVGTPKHSSSSSTKSPCVSLLGFCANERARVFAWGVGVCMCVSLEASSTAPLSVLPDMRRAPKKR